MDIKVPRKNGMTANAIITGAVSSASQLSIAIGAKYNADKKPTDISTINSNVSA